MSDEEIYQALGSAQASEDGLARAMAIVEEQANLREHDNQLFAEWVARMQASDAPEAKIALENIERAKQGLEPLPFVSQAQQAVDAPVASPVEDVVAALNAAHESQPVVEDIELVEEVIEDDETPPSIFAALHETEATPAAKPILEEVSVVEIPIEVPVAVASEEDAFDQLLADSAAEATTAIYVAGAEPVVTFDLDENYSVAAEEDATVAEELKPSKHVSGWWQNAAFWVIAVGVLVPVVAAYLAADAGLSLSTALTGFGLGLLVNIGLIVSAHFTAQRSGEDSPVVTRATFGVFGAGVPGLAAFVTSGAVLVLAAIGIVASFNGVFDLGAKFSAPVAGNLSLGTALAISALVVATLFASFGARLFGWLNAVIASVTLIAFVVVGLLTRSMIDFGSIDLSVNYEQAGLLLLGTSLMGVFFYGKAPRVQGANNGLANTTARWSAIAFAAVLLPLAVFAHFELLFTQHLPDDGFQLVKVAQLLPNGLVVDVIVWIIAAAAIALLLNLANGMLTNLKSFALNRIPAWLGVVVALVLCALVFVLPNWSTWLQIAEIAIAVFAVGVGFAIAESILRRGRYHEASLLRAYGFYGSFNIVGVLGFVFFSAATLGISVPNDLAPWLGFTGWTSAFAPAIGLAAGFAWVFATAIPRILVQQREVSEVELRKASLSEFTGFSE